MPTDGTVQFENLTNNMGVLVVSGPKARELMKRVSTDDFSSENFKWLSAKNVNIGNAPVNAMRVNFVGELGWELHHPIEYQNHIFDRLMEAGKDLSLKPYGIRAMNSLRVEKSYKLVGTELSIEYSPYESGLDRFIHPNKGKFIGLEALNRWREKGFQNKLVEAGKDLGLKPYGIRAMNSLRVEKSYKLVGTELSIEYSPYESGLDRFVHPNKGNFIGLELSLIHI